MTKRLTAILITAVLMLTMALTGCGGSGDSEGKGDDKSKDTIELGYVTWVCANSNSHMVKAVIEEKFDVNVNLRDMDAGLLWQSVATGDIDFMVTANLPTTHAAYYEKLGDEIELLSPIYNEAKIGLVVPSYVTIDSIDEINESADKFGGQIVGIDAGAGIMTTTNTALTDYAMDGMKLVQSSDAAMTAELKTAYENGEWVVITGWTPHWMFDAFDLKFLDDPHGIYGGNQDIQAITRLGFAEDYPEINAFLDSYTLTTEQFGSLITAMEEYDDDNEAARAWVEENRELVDSWFE